jgi:phosphoribosylformylglycinamidine synthase
MPHRLEITLKPGLFDPEGAQICKKAASYFALTLESVRVIHILTMDAALSPNRLKRIQEEVFTNPVTQVSSYEPLHIPFDWMIWVGYRPGVRDNPGSTAMEAVEDILKKPFKAGEGIYTSRRFCITGSSLTKRDVAVIAGELLANDIIQQWRIFSKDEWNPRKGIGFIIPKVKLNRIPCISTIPINTDETLRRISDKRNLALNPNDIPVIRRYFRKKSVIKERAVMGLSDPTDVEIEYISQARSDHCNHNTFRGKFLYRDLKTGKHKIVDNLFKTDIEAPTLLLKKKKPWVISVLWDNAGVGRLNDGYFYVITGETHNSPSNMEAYGGALTGIVGIYRDPMGTGKGSKLIMGSYGFCVGERDYRGNLKPRLHPRRLLDGVIEGVKDGGNKSGIPTVFGQVVFHPGYMGKCLVFVTAMGIMPSKIDGKPSDQKSISPDDLVIMCGGRVGKDGIHGVTASSETFSDHTPAGHVQIGDPYTQKKMHDFLLEARDEGLIQFITDNGGGGLSSSVGESARFSNGCRIELDKVPLKYEGLDQWEIWVSESQERMTVAVSPENIERFMALSKKHAVESTVIGRYTDSGKLHIIYNNETCAYVDLNLLSAGFPQWEFEAEWTPPQLRGRSEPALKEPKDYDLLIKDILSRPNICSKEWIIRQYDHEVQGTSVIKPLVGRDRDVNSDAAVLRPVLGFETGLAFAQAILPSYSQIDAYHMAACTIDEALRRILAVGGTLDHVAGVDNFCWPNIQYDPVENPDGKLKAAQLVRACKAMHEICLDYEIPLLSGKDSMYIDGHLPGKYGETHKVSGLETLQFSTAGVIESIRTCVTMDPKMPGDLIYILGVTRDELGGSEYYEHFGYVGLNVPQVRTKETIPLYRALEQSVKEGLVSSVHGIYRGGLGTHLAMMGMAGMLGMEIELAKIPTAGNLRSDKLLFSESAGRFIATINPGKRKRFEKILKGLPSACIGKVKADECLVIKNCEGEALVSVSVRELKVAWKRPFGDLI